jgi:uncharacterized LabA/DUF88 family protein
MSTYAFLDGNYIRRASDELMKQMFDVPADLDFAKMSGLGDRVYYYDCLDDLKRASESDQDFKLRLDRQTDEFNVIQSLPKFHVRYGSLTGENRKRRQKKVDVQLAVDALEHAFRRNMTHAILMAGDLDFAPLVDCLVRVGTRVTVMYERTSATSDLYRAADIGAEINIVQVHGWSTNIFQQRHSLPNTWMGGTTPHVHYIVQRVGSVQEKAAYLHHTKVQPENFVLEIKNTQGTMSLFIQSAVLDAIERYVRLVYSPIVW